jgi:hypothetical protein
MHIFAHEILRVDNPWCAFAELPTQQGAITKHPQDCGGTDEQSLRGLAERYLAAFGTLALSISRNLLVLPQGADTTAGPAIATTGGLARAVQDGGDRFIRQLASEDSYKLDDVGIGSPAILTGLILLHANRV